MSKVSSTASWIGKAAYEIMQVRGLNGRDANAMARAMADGLLDFGIDLARIDPREHVRTGSCRRSTAQASGQPWMARQPTERQNRQSAFLN
jgi:hypothetical protein